MKAKAFSSFCLKKNTAGAAGNYRSFKIQPVQDNEIQITNTWLQHPDNFVLHRHQSIITALSNPVQEMLQYAGNWKLIQAGISVGEIKQNQLVPDHALIMSGLTNSAIPVIELNDTTAIQYLKKESIQLNTPGTGWYIVQFQIPLGVVKAIPGRINNYYPTEWRIRK